MTSSAPPILVLDQASRRLGGRSVVRGLGLELRRGEVLGLLGVNGAGKTTSLRMMAGVLAPSGGLVRLQGEDLYERPEQARRLVGYLPETPPLHDELSAEEFLGFCARLHGVARGAVAAAVAGAIERCGLGDVRRRPLGALSKGYRQRVGIAQAIVHAPSVIVLDEPASGLDPVQALNLRRLVRSLGEDAAVVLSTHLLPDVAACCDRVAILHRGELRHLGPLAPQEGLLRVRTTKRLHAVDWQALPPVAAAAPQEDGGWRVRLRPGAGAAELATLLVERGLGLEELSADVHPLERTFLAIAAADLPAEAA